MSRLQVRPYQLLDGTKWNGYTERNHLFTAFADDPIYYMDTVQRVWDMNLGEDFASMVEKQGVEYIDASSEGTFEWKLDLYIDSNYECRGSWLDADGTTAVTASDKVGANGSSWYMDFQGNPFNKTEIIAGRRPNVDRLYVQEEGFNVGSDIYRYKVSHSYARTVDDYFDGDVVLENTLWSSEAGLVSNYWSDTGVDISFRTPARMRGEMSSFRVKHRIAGHLVENYRPKYFYVTDPKSGKVMDKPLWISTVELEFLRKIRQVRAHLLMYGKSNRMLDGTYSLQDNGYEIKAGSGWHEQALNGNSHVYVGAPSLATIQSIIQDLVVGKVSREKRDVTISAGEYGLAELSNMVMRAYGEGAYKVNTPLLNDSSGRAYNWEGNNVTINFGQVTGVALMNGIRVKFVLDPSKDDPRRNQVLMGSGLNGFASSYQYDINVLGMGGQESNYKIVRRQNQTPVFGVIEGMRGMLSGGSSFGAPKQLSNPLDGMEIHYQEHGLGAKLADPTKVIRYYPAVLPE